MVTKTRPLGLVLVDGNSLFREGLRRILEAHPQFRVVGEASDSERAVKLVAATAPDTVLLDVRVCGDDAARTVNQIRKLAPACSVIVLTAEERVDLLGSLLEAGIRGYLLKSVSRQELVTAINSVTCDPNRVVLSVSLASLASGGPNGVGLSGRQLEVLKLVATAMSNGQIATRLSLTQPTVKRHLSNIFARLDAVSRIDAVNKARQLGLISPSVGADSGR
jgi:DNA-binding NarL/FixJ family response regulator